MPITMFNRVLTAMLPDILCKCKARCTFICFVHRISVEAHGGR